MGRRLAVIGAGVSGLAAAHAAAEEAGRAPSVATEEGRGNLEITVLERRTEVGGRARSLLHEGWLVEGGPGGYLDTDPEVAALVESVGLGAQRLRARPAAARRYIYHGGRLHEVGPNLMRPLRTGLLSLGSVLRVFGEPFIGRRVQEGEESIFDFCRRRFGIAIAERLVHPAMLGIFAGDARRLSVDACFPELKALESEHGSVIRGAIARRGRPLQARGTGTVPSRKLTSFRSGLQQLPRTLAADRRIQVRTGAAVTALRRFDGGYRIETEGYGVIEADAVVVAAPVQRAARILSSLSLSLAEDLGQVEVPPVAVVGLGFDAPAVSGIPSGFGVLVARGQGTRMLGCLWESNIYPGRSPEGKFLARAMYGGRLDPLATELEDAELLEQASRDLHSVLGVDSAPEYTRIVRWPHAIPQYEIGHLTIKATVERQLAALPGIFLAGDALDGVSYTKTAAAGLRRGRAAARFLLDRP